MPACDSPPLLFSVNRSLSVAAGWRSAPYTMIHTTHTTVFTAGESPPLPQCRASVQDAGPALRQCRPNSSSGVLVYCHLPANAILSRTIHVSGAGMTRTSSCTFNCRVRGAKLTLNRPENVTTSCSM